MKRLVLTDALIREALSPDPHVTAPAGLLAQITADVARTPQHRTLRLPALPRSRRLAWVLVGAATLLALARGAARRRRLTEPARGLPAASPVAAAAAAAGRDRPLGPRSRPSAPTRPGRATARTGCGTGPPPAGPGQSRWAPPALLEPAYIRDLARMPDGRIVVGADSGMWVGNEDGWTRLAAKPIWGVAADESGVVWAASLEGGQHLEAYREVDGSWRSETHPCAAGGELAAATADGSVWTAGIGTSAEPGIARLQRRRLRRGPPVGRWSDPRCHGNRDRP